MTAALAMMTGMVVPVISNELPDASVQASPVELYCLMFPDHFVCRWRA